LESELSGNAASVAQLSEQVKLLHEQGAQFSQILISQEQTYKGVIEKLEERIIILESHKDAEQQHAKDTDGSVDGTLKTPRKMTVESQAPETPFSHRDYSCPELKDMESEIQQKQLLYEKRLGDLEATLTQLQQHLHSQLVAQQSQLSQVYMLVGNSLMEIDRRSVRSGKVPEPGQKANSRSTSRALESDRTGSAGTRSSSRDSFHRHSKDAETDDSDKSQLESFSAFFPKDKLRICGHQTDLVKPRMC